MTAATANGDRPPEGNLRGSSSAATGGRLRALAVALYRRPRAQLGLLLAAPLGWLGIAYLGSLALFLVTSFWSVDSFTGNVVRDPTIKNYVDVATQEIYRTATDLFTALGLQRARIRLVGVRVEGLVPRSTVQRQLVLGEREHGWSEADVAVDRATRRFGVTAVRPASLLAEGGAGSR